MASQARLHLIILFILLWGLAGCNARPSENPDVLIARQACEKAADALERYQCLEKHALASGNPEICRLTGADLETRCLTNLYQKSPDPSLCSRMYRDDIRQACELYYTHQNVSPTPIATPTPIPLPSPTPTPTPLGEMPIGQVLPVAVTPPPPSWYPTVPDGSPALNPVAWMRAHLRLLTDLLNSSPDVEQALQRYALLIPQQAGRTENPEALWSMLTELDQDGAYEWLISIPHLDRPCPDTDCYTYLAIFRYQEGLFIPVGVLPAANWSEGWANLRFISVEDLDADGNNELVLSTQIGEETQVLVGRWKEEAGWQSLNADPMTFPNAEVHLEDLNGDGLTEILLHGGVIQDPQAGLQRPRTRVYALQYRRYVLKTTLSEADNHIYYRMLDARSALETGDIYTALDLAESILNEGQYSNYAYINSYAESRIVPYAGVLAMLAHMQLDQPGLVAELMIEIERRYGESGSPFVDGARAAWQAYRQSQDPVKACQVLEAVSLRVSEAPFFELYGTRTERITTWDVCPLDEKPHQGTPTDL